MELIRGLQSLRSDQSSCAATIGAFDGVHRGHQAVIEQLRGQAQKHGLPTTVVTFEPLPREYFALEEAPARLQSFRERFESIAALGVDRLICLRFDDTLRAMSAGEFARSLFVDGLGVKSLVIGDDFRFGKAREGDIAFVRRLGDEVGFETHSTRTVEVAGERVSSTRLREALSRGDVSEAKELLGRDYSMSGRVHYGKQLGRQIGAPTANIALRRRSVPLSGVFAVRVNGAGVDGQPGVANVGMRPTVEAAAKPNLEVHLLDAEGDLYGKRLKVEFLYKVRDEQRFESIETLKKQIHSDFAAARAWFTSAEIGTEAIT
ncbi:MAG: bifunctional riboflavin kinase/FAD synthetase [Pseudomonadota bacterium]